MPFIYNTITPINKPAPIIAACVGFGIPAAKPELEAPPVAWLTPKLKVGDPAAIVVPWAPS